MKALRIFLMLIFLTPGSGPAQAADAPQEARVRRIALQLSCTICEGQSVADSQSVIAGDIRAFIRARIAQGSSDKKIFEMLRNTYGDRVFLMPPVAQYTLGLWIAPLAGLWIGATLLILFYRRARPKGRRV